MHVISRRLGAKISLVALCALARGAYAEFSTDTRSSPYQFNFHYLSNYLNQIRVVGQGKFTYWGFDVYWATLLTDEAALQPTTWRSQHFALELRYLRAFQGKDIARQSIDEMQGQEAIPADKANTWRKTLENILPNVRAGQSLTGIYSPTSGSQLLFNEKPIGVIEDTELSERFFAIWLSPKTSAPQLRAQLLMHS